MHHLCSCCFSFNCTLKFLFCFAFFIKGSLESLKKDGHLYDTPKEESPTAGMWGGPVEKLVSESSKKNEFKQDLDNIDEGKLEVIN